MDTPPQGEKKSSTLDELSREDLIRFVRKQTLNLQKMRQLKEDLEKKVAALEEEQKKTEQSSSVSNDSIARKLSEEIECLTQKNESLQMMFRSLENESKEYKNQLNIMESARDEAVMAAQKLKEEVAHFRDNDLSSQLGQKDKRIEELLVLKAELDAEVLTLKRAVEVANSSANSSIIHSPGPSSVTPSAQLAESDELIANLQEQLEQERMKIGQMEEELAGLKEKSTSFDDILAEKNRLSEVNAEIQQNSGLLKQQLDDASAELEKIRNDLSEALSQTGELSKQNQSRLEECEKLKQENSSLALQMSDLLDQAKAREDTETRDNERNMMKISDLEARLEQSALKRKEALDHLSEKLKKEYEEKLSDETSQLQIKIDSLSRQMELKEQEFELALQETRKNSESSLNNVLSNAGELEAANGRLVAENGQLKEQHLLVKQRLEHSERDVRELQSAKQDLENVSSELSSAKEKLQSSKSVISKKEQEVASCRSQIAELQESVNKLESSLAEKSAAVDEFSSELQAKSESMERLTGIVDSKGSELEDLQKQVGGLISELDCKKSETSRLHTDLAEAKDVIEILTTNFEQANRDVEDKMTALESMTAESQRKTEEINTLKAKIDSLTQTVSELNSQIEAAESSSADISEELKASGAKLRSQVEEKTREIANLTSQLKANSGKCEAEMSSKSAEVDEANEKLGQMASELERAKCAECQMAESNRVLTQQLAELKQKHDSMETTLSGKFMEIEKNSAKLSEKTKQADSLCEEIASKNEEISRLEQQLNAGKVETDRLVGASSSQVDCLKAENVDLTKQIEAKTAEFQTAQTNFQKQVKVLESKLDAAVAAESQCKSDCSSLTDKISELSAENEVLKKQVDEKSAQVTKLTTDFKAKYEKLLASVSGKSEEFASLTQKTKTLSEEVEEKSTEATRLGEECRELAEKNEKLLVENKEIMAELTEKSAELVKAINLSQELKTAKDGEIERLQGEVQRLQAENEAAAADHERVVKELEVKVAETMSQISEAGSVDGDESEKLRKELSEKTEFISKLKAIAVKQKRELIEAKAKGDDLRSKWESELARKAGEFMDLHQKQESEIDSVKRELEAKCDEARKLEEKVSAMQMLQVKFDQLTVNKGELEEKCRDLVHERARLSSKVAEMESRLAENDRATKESGMLSLEVADCHRRMSSLRDQLASQKTELDSATEANQNLTDQMQDKENEYQEVMKRLTASEERESRLNDAIKSQNDEVSKLKSSQQESGKEIAALRVTVEQRQSDIERLRVELSQAIADRMDAEQRGKMMKSDVDTRLTDLQALLNSTRSESEFLKKTNDDLKREFDAYKVRALTVLKQQRESDASGGSQMKERVAELETLLTDANTRLAEQTAMLDSAKLENRMTKAELDRLASGNSALESDLRNKILSLESELMSARQHRDDALREANTKSVQMAADFRREIASLSDRHDNVVRSLGEQLSAAECKITELTAMLANRRDDAYLMSSASSVVAEEFSQPVSVSELSATNELHTPTQGHSPVSASPVPSNSHKPVTPLMPLESLLNFDNSAPASSAVANRPMGQTALPSGAVSPASVTSPTTAITRTHFPQNAQHIEGHLRDLLAESETNVSRLTEQTRVLKDEIRRLERNQARSERISNLEYLKHIVVKFLTLKTSSERVQLLPVLNTILQLSNEENQQLLQIAQQTATGANANNPASPGSGTGSSSGLVGYLHRWSGMTS